MPGVEEFARDLIADPENAYITKDPTLEEVIYREKQFALNVAYAGLLMSERHSGIVTLLADVDQTFTENSGITIRPAFPFALNILYKELGNRLEVGLLTTNRQEGINDNLPIYFKGVDARVNSDFVISSREMEEADPRLQQAVDNDNYAIVRDIVEPQVIEDTQAGELSDIWFGTKLIILQELARQHPERSFVFVDDLIWADVIQDMHRQVRGLWVGQYMQNDLVQKDLDQLRIKKTGG